MRPLTKRIFLTALTCHTLGRLMRQDKIHTTITAADRFQIEQGQDIGKRARALYPEGTLIATREFDSAVAATPNLMSDPDTKTLFEPVFLTDDFSTRADILTRKLDGSWHMTEVKTRVEEFKPICTELEELTRTPEKPKPELRLQCRGCARSLRYSTMLEFIHFT